MCVGGTGVKGMMLRGAGGWSGPSRRLGLEQLAAPQELLLRANIEAMRCAVPRTRGEPPEQVTPSPPGFTGPALPGQAEGRQEWPGASSSLSVSRASVLCTQYFCKTSPKVCS